MDPGTLPKNCGLPGVKSMFRTPVAVGVEIDTEGAFGVGTVTGDEPIGDVPVPGVPVGTPRLTVPLPNIRLYASRSAADGSNGVTLPGGGGGGCGGGVTGGLTGGVGGVTGGLGGGAMVIGSHLPVTVLRT